MSSYDCVLPIMESKLRAIVETSSKRGQQIDEWPVTAATLREHAGEPDFRAFDAILAAAAIVESISPDRFYGRLQGQPQVVVAGAKNGFSLNGLDKTWVPNQELYRCAWRAPSEATALLDELLHGQRGVPGLAVLPESPAWPAFDDPMVLGYLLVAEVKRLNARVGTLSDNPHACMLRAIIERAAESSLCLVTLQSGL